MQNQVQVFQNEEFGKIEVMMIGGKPHFPATECATILDYKRPHDAISRHCRYSVKHGVPHPQSIDKEIEKTYIPEGDLYRLIIRSKLPAAVRFEAWICDEVLPSIRQYGAYITPHTLELMQSSVDFAEELLHNLSDAYAKNRSLTDQVDALQPKAQYCDVVLQAETPICTTLIAKSYGMTAIAFNRMLHSLGVQYRIGSVWHLYKQYADKGYTVTKTYLVGDKKVSVHTAWTQRGRFWLYDFLAWYGIFPTAERLMSA